MPIKFDIINPLLDPRWNEFLASSNDDEYFHGREWAAVLHDSYGYQPLYCVGHLSDGGCIILPIMEVRSLLTGIRGVSLPFTDYSGFRCGSMDAYMSMIGYLRRVGRTRSWKWLEIRGGDGIPSELPPSSVFYRHILDLSKPFSDLERRFSENARRNIRKAVQAGVTITWSSSTEGIRDFFRLHCITRKRHGIPPPPIRFFSVLHQHIIQSGLGIIGLAEYQNRIISAAVFLNRSGKAIFKYGASDALHQNLGASHLVMSEAIRRFHDLACQSLCFGRTDADDEGLRRYKKSWGTSEYPLNYYRCNVATGEYLHGGQKPGGQMAWIASKLPVPLLRGIGTVLYRHIG